MGNSKSTTNDHCDINCRLKMVESKLSKAYPSCIHTVRLQIGCTVGKYLEHQDNQTGVVSATAIINCTGSNMGFHCSQVAYAIKPDDATEISGGPYHLIVSFLFDSV
jgi:hypothetical protein